MASSEFGNAVQSELQALGINTQPEVQDFRVPGERRNEQKTPTAGDMHTVITNIQAARGQYWISRKRMRHDALRLLHEGQL